MIEHSQTNSAMGPGAEFDSIRAMLAEWGEFAEGIGDDAAVLSVPAGMQLLVSTDAAVEDVHFRRKWISARDAGARAATAAFSDLAAMGATANAILVSLVVPTIWREHIREFATGIKATVASVNARIVGGNISRGASFSCTLTVIGYSAKPVRRSGAQIGDALYVTGKLGGPAAAVAAWERSEQPADWARQRFLAPVARVREGQWLAAHGAHAMIDISDGLAADARHLSAASAVQCVVGPELVPRFESVSVQDALAAGEEYELLVALPANRGEEIATDFRRQFEIEFTLVGMVEAVQESAARVELPVGHDHFSTQ
ncbi:MAG: thiamine-phosphate kinase [Gemmatimonadaceae bacterium]